MHRTWIRPSFIRPALRGLLGSLVALAAVGCLDDTPVTAVTPSVRATLNANVVGAMAGGTVRIRVGYRTSQQVLVPLPSSPQQVVLAAGATVVVPVTVDIGPCLSDASRMSANERGCRLTIELTLTDAAGATVDTQTRDAATPATPGQSVNFGTVTIGVIVSTISIAPPSLSMNVSEEQQISATVRDALGAVVTTAPVLWTTSDPTVAQLATTAGNSVTVKALKLGTATVSASAGGKTSNAVTVNVMPPTPLVIRQRPAPGCAILGHTLTLDVDTPPGPVTWSSSSPSIATVGATTGIVTAVGLGNATVTATSGNRTGSLAICVIALREVLDNSTIVAGRTAQITPSTVTGGTLSFASSATGIATVDANGLIRGVSVGQATITATLSAGSGTVDTALAITVTAASVAISPTSASAPINGAARFAAVVLDANGATLPGVPATWSIADASIGSLSATLGTTVDVQALKVGSTTVRATAGGASGSATFNATQPLPAARLEKVSGDGTSCPTRSTACTFVVRAVDVNGVPVPGASVSWFSSFSCGPAKIVATDVLGLASATNLCSAPTGAYTQTATLQANQQQVAFSYSLRGLKLTLESIDSAGVATYAVTSATPAAGLTVKAEFVSGPASNYLNMLELKGTATPTVLMVGYDSSGLPFGNYTFNVVVSTTTPGLGPGVETITFSTTATFFKQPNAQRRSEPARAPADRRAP